MTRYIRCLLFCAALSAVLAGGLSAAEPKDAAKPEKPSPSAAKPQETPKAPAADAAVSHRLKREPLKIEVTVKGTLEAEKTAEVVLRPEVWAMFEVLKAAEHGQAVKRGDVLVQFDPQKIDDEIADLRLKRAVSDLTFKQAVETLFEIMKETLERGEDVKISGFGKFVVKQKASRRGRNPQTAADIQLRERRVVIFRTSGVLRKRINEGPPSAP